MDAGFYKPWQNDFYVILSEKKKTDYKYILFVFIMKKLKKSHAQLFYMFRKGNPLVSQGHLKVISKSPSRVISVVLSKYEENPPINEKVMTKKN